MTLPPRKGMRQQLLDAVSIAAFQLVGTHPMTTPSEPVNLLPCPFCGGEILTPFHSNFLNKEVHAVFCDACQTEGPHHFTEAEAIAAWNTRRPAAPWSEDVVEAVAELQLAAFLAGRGSIVRKEHNSITTARPAPTVDEFRSMARAALSAIGDA